jgi:hypothetical protein
MLREALRQTQDSVGQIQKNMPSVMGEIVDQTIQVPLDAIDNFMESNYFTRILKGAFLAHRARKKAALKEEKMRLEQIKSEREAKAEEQAQITNFYNELLDNLMGEKLEQETDTIFKDIQAQDPSIDPKDAFRIATEQARENVPDDVKKEVREKTFEKFSYGSDEELLRDTLGMERAATEVERAADSIRQWSDSTESFGLSPKQRDEKDAIYNDIRSQVPDLPIGDAFRISTENVSREEEDSFDFTPQRIRPRRQPSLTPANISGGGLDLTQILQGISTSNSLLNKILVDGLGARSPGWLSHLVNNSKLNMEVAKRQAIEFKDGIKEQSKSIGDNVKESASMFTDGLKEEFAPFVDTFKKAKERTKKVIGGVKGMFGGKKASQAEEGEEGLTPPSPKISDGITKIFDSLKGGISGIGKGIAKSIRAIFSAIANGFKKLGHPKVLRGALTIPIIAAALLLFAGAMWIFGKVNWGGAMMGILTFASFVAIFALTAPLLAPLAPLMTAVAAALTALMIPLLMFAGAMLVIAVSMKIFASALTEMAAIPFTDLLQLWAVGIMFAAISPMLAFAGLMMLIAAPGFILFGAGLMLLATGISTFASVGFGTILAMITSLYALTALALPLALASPFLALASIGFGMFGIGLMLLGKGISMFVGTIPAIIPMVAALYALTLLALPLALASPFLAIASIGFGMFGIGLMSLATGIGLFVGTIPAIIPMVAALYVLTALAIPLALASPLLAIAAIGFGLFGIGLMSLATGIRMFVDIMPAILPMVAALYALAALAIPLALASPFLAIASIGFGMFGIALTVLAFGVSMFVGTIPAIIPMVAALYALAALAIPLALASPLLLAASVGILAFGIALIPLAFGISLIDLNSALEFALAMGVIVLAVIPLAILSMSGMMYVAAAGLTALAVGILAVGVAGIILGSNSEVLSTILGQLTLLALLSPLLVLAAIGIFMVSGALVAFGAANLVAAGMMAAASAINAVSSFFGGTTPLEMLLIIAAHAGELYVAGKGIMFMAMGISLLAKSLKDLDPDVLSEIGESMQGILPGVIGGDMNFVAGNLIMGQEEPSGAKGMAADNLEASSLARGMTNINAPANTIVVGGGGGEKKEKTRPSSVEGGRMNENTFRRIQERFYKSAIV